MDGPVLDGGRMGGTAPNFEEAVGWLILGGAKWGSWDIGEDCHGPTMKTIVEGGATAAWKGSGWLGSADMGRESGVPPRSRFVAGWLA